MNELPPFVAAKAAAEVYALTGYDTLEEALKYLNEKYGGVFAFADNNMLKVK